MKDSGRCCGFLICVASLITCLSGKAEGQSDLTVTPTYQSSGFAEPLQKSIAVGADGLSRFVVGDSSASAYGDEITYVRCLSADCSTFNTQSIPTGPGTYGNSIALGPDGFARIAYATMGGPDVPPGHQEFIGFIQRLDADCSSFSQSYVDGGSDNGVSAIAVGSDGTSYIVYDYGTDDWSDAQYTQGIGLATCQSGGCAPNQVVSGINVDDSITAAITIGSDGSPVVVYEDSGNS